MKEQDKCLVNKKRWWQLYARHLWVLIKPYKKIHSPELGANIYTTYPEHRQCHYCGQIEINYFDGAGWQIWEVDIKKQAEDAENAVNRLLNK